MWARGKETYCETHAESLHAVPGPGGGAAGLGLWLPGQVGPGPERRSRAREGGRSPARLARERRRRFHPLRQGRGGVQGQGRVRHAPHAEGLRHHRADGRQDRDQPRAPPDRPGRAAGRRDDRGGGRAPSRRHRPGRGDPGQRRGRRVQGQGGIGRLQPAQGVRGDRGRGRQHQHPPRRTAHPPLRGARRRAGGGRGRAPGRRDRAGARDRGR